MTLQPEIRVGEPVVAVVIPTILRPSLSAAVTSVRRQNWPGRVEVVVVVDRNRADCEESELAHARGADLVHFTGGRQGAAAARNLGVRSSSGDVVAFLDDDDEWTEHKLTHQMAALIGENGALQTDVIVGSRAVERPAGGTELSRPIPLRLVRPDEPIEDYLFKSRRPGLGRASFFTSCALTSRELALGVPWTVGLRRHQDWDWLIRSQYEVGARFVQVEAATVVYALGSPGSISGNCDWRSSLDWARGWRAVWDPKTYVDFVTGQPLRYAVQSRSSAGIRACLREITSGRSLPHVGPAVLAAGSVLPRKTLERQILRLAQRGVA